MTRTSTLILSFLISPLASLAHPATPCVEGQADIYSCSGIDLEYRVHLEDLDIGGLPGNVEGSDIWGWTSEDGREFALVGLTNQTAFVEITDSQNPVYLGSLPTASFDVNVWRDIKTYGHYALIVADHVSNHGMQVFDLEQLLIATPPVTFVETAHYDGFARAHNIVVNEESGYAYAVGTNTCSGGLHVIDIQDPTDPTGAGCFASDGYTHDAQCVTYDGPDADYQGHELCFASNEDTLTIVDVSDKVNMTEISRNPYANHGYTHQGWVTEDHRYLLLDDETDELNQGHSTKTRIWDLADLDNPLQLNTYIGSVSSSDHNLYISGDYAYLANYRSGLRILDIRDIGTGTLSEVAFFDTYPSSDGPGFAGAWSSYPYFESGNVIVSDIQGGLFVLRPLSLCAANPGPGDLVAAAGGDHEIQLTWTATGLPDETYRVYRSAAGCKDPSWELVAEGVTGGSYLDTQASGSVQYGYSVSRLEGPACETAKGACTEASTTGSCTAPPLFDGLDSVTDLATSSCSTGLDWAPATTLCGESSKYSVYRSPLPEFLPGPGNLVASGVSTTEWVDTDVSGESTSFYLVRATDVENGATEANTNSRGIRPTGPATDATWETGAEFGDPSLDTTTQTLGGGHQERHAGWHISNARQFEGDRSFYSEYANGLCSSLTTPTIELSAGESSTLAFWTVFDIEEEAGGGGTAWDGGVVEMSVDGGVWTRLNLTPDYPMTFRSSSDACDYATGTPCFSGTNWTWTRHSADLSPSNGSEVEIRWQFSTDGGATEEGWYVDSIELTHALIPGSCSSSFDPLFVDGFESGDLSEWAQ